MLYKVSLLFISFLLTSSIAYTQNSSDKVALSSLLLELEKSYNIKFSYSDTDVKDLFIKQPEEGISVTKILSFLNKNTFLQFKTLDNRYITVSFLNKYISLCGIVLESQSLSPLLLTSVKVNGSKLGSMLKIADCMKNLNSIQNKTNEKKLLLF